VAIAPERVLPRRCPARVDHARLRDQAERAVRVPAGVHVRLAAGHLIEGATDVQGTGLPAGGSLPGHRTAKCPVHLADTGAVPEAPQRPALPGGERSSGQIGELARREIKQNCPRGRQVRQRPDPLRGLELAAQRGKLGGQRVDEPGAAAFHYRPADGVRDHHEHQAERPGARSSQRQHGVRRRASEKGASFLGAEALREQAGRRQAADGEPGHRDRVVRQRPQRRQHVRQDERRLPH